MNIAVFGANGAIGQIVTRLALGGGDIVTAYVRRPESIKLTHPNLNVVVGDLSDVTAIEAAIESADAVISALGPKLDRSRKRQGTPIADGHERIIQAMQKFNKKRLITLATPALKSDADIKSIATVLPGFMAKTFLPSGYAEMKKLETVIKQSQVDWTVIRIINPNVKHTGQAYGYSFGDKPAKMSVSRENVARMMVDAVRNDSWIKKMPIVFNR